MADHLPIRVVGWGPFPLPGEKKRWRRAEAKARRLLRLAHEVRTRTQDGER